VAVVGSLVLVNNVLYQNLSREHGGLSADARLESYLECMHNTVADNEAPDTGVWIDVAPDSMARIANNLFWGNGGVDYTGPASPHSLIGTGTNGGEGNLSADPLFYDPEYGDYRLTILSPCVDRGDGGMLPPEVTTDAAGRPRVRGAAVDPGAYEFVSGRQLIADLRSEVETLEEAGRIAGRTPQLLRQRLMMADYYLRRARGTEVWSLYYLASFATLVREQTGATVQPDAADRLIAAALAIYDQVERWGG
jgi:hypothetical protein